MQFVWSKLATNNKRTYKSQKAFDINTIIVSKHGEMMDFISSLPPFLQLSIISVLLILSLILYEANINKTNLIVFIILRSIAFCGIILDVYLFLKLIPMNNNKQDSKPYHTQSYKQNTSNIRIPNKCNSAPPILHTLYPRKHKPMNTNYRMPFIISDDPNITPRLPALPSNDAQHQMQHCVNVPETLSSHGSDEDTLDGMATTDAIYESKVLNGGECIEMNDDESGESECVKIERRQTTNKKRLKVMMRKRREREKVFGKKRKKIKRKKAKIRRKCKVKRKQTRIALCNTTKLQIVRHYLREKRRNRNYNATKCKLYFLNDKSIECGAIANITKWSRNINKIKQNIKRFGKNKKRNRNKPRGKTKNGLIIMKNKK